MNLRSAAAAMTALVRRRRTPSLPSHLSDAQLRDIGFERDDGVWRHVDRIRFGLPL